MTTQRQYGDGDASYQAAGQFEGLIMLAERFYFYMDTLPEAAVIRGMHADDLTESKDKLARFLSAWLGGPKLYSEKYGPIAIPRAHAHLPIGSDERDAWLLCMEKALAEQPYAEDFKAYMLKQLSIPAERCRTRT
jgi:hemoglobin